MQNNNNREGEFLYFQFSIINYFVSLYSKLNEDEQRIPPNRRSDCRYA